MAGRSATEMIWFAVSVVVAISLIGVFIGIAYSFSSRIQDNAREEAANYYASVNIINDPAQMPYNRTTGNLTIYAKNTGRYELDTRRTLIDLNGGTRYVNDTDINIIGEETEWKQNSVAKINVSGKNLKLGEDNYIRIEVQGEFQGRRMGRDSDTLDFYIEP